MAKNDKVKEELAESRHDDVIGIMLGTFGFAGLSAVFAYWQVQGWLAGIELLVIIGVGFWVVCSIARRKAKSRKDKIKQLGNKK